MPSYSYTARTFSGQLHTGQLDAADERKLAQALRREGYVLISARPVASAAKKSGRARFQRLFSWLKGVPLAEKMMLTRNLKVMIAGGLSLPRALTILANQTKSKRLQKALSQSAAEITRGKGFAESLMQHPAVFSEFFCSMIRVGEEAGTLEDVLEVLTRHMEREHELRARIKGAMVYPAVILCAMILIGAVMLIVVVPKLAATFEELGVELPLTTRIVIGLGTFLATFWYFIPFLLLAAWVAFRAAVKTSYGKHIADTILLKIPIISPIVKKTYTAYTIRTLGSLIEAGVPIVNGLEVVSGSLTNIHYKRAMAHAAERVKKGAKLAEALKPYEATIYPSLVVQMIAVGEETGETSSMLSRLADFFEEEVGRATKNLSAVIEPALMLVIGAVVGFFAVSMVQPMYSMMQAF